MNTASPSLRDISLTLGNVNTLFAQDTQIFLDIAKAKRENFDNEDIRTVCFWYKCLARTFLAQADGVAWMMRRALDIHADAFGVRISEKKRKKIAEGDRPTPFLEGIKLALAHFPRLFDIDVDPGLSSAKFHAFRDLVRYREGLNHPSFLTHTSPLGLFRCLPPAVEWYLQNVRSLIVKCSQATGLPLPETPTPPNRFQYKPGDVSRMDVLTLELLEEQLRASIPGQVEFFHDQLSGEVANALRFWHARGFSWSIQVERQAALRNFVRTLVASLEGGAVVAIRCLQAIGSETESAQNLLRGNHVEVTKTISRIAVDFSRSWLLIPKGTPGHRSEPHLS